jgi:chromosomal replication initiation ATPase DnaA
MALPFDPRPCFEAADFIAAPSNESARAWLARPEAWPQLRLALWGPEGCGKTHLLHVWAVEHDADVVHGQDLASDGIPPPPERAVALDAADLAPERTLLHVLNAAAETGHPVLLAARQPPGRWNTALPDLASRLRAVTAVAIGAAEDELLRLLLQRLLVERQLAVPEAVQEYLLRHLPRTPAAMRLAAARLDRAALAARRAVSRGLAAETLADLLAGADGDSVTGPGLPSPMPGGVV